MRRLTRILLGITPFAVLGVVARYVPELFRGLTSCLSGNCALPGTHVSLLQSILIGTLILLNGGVALGLATAVRHRRRLTIRRQLIDELALARSLGIPQEPIAPFPDVAVTPDSPTGLPVVVSRGSPAWAPHASPSLGHAGPLARSVESNGQSLPAAREAIDWNRVMEEIDRIMDTLLRGSVKTGGSSRANSPTPS
jgi:hypothetical protein